MIGGNDHLGMVNNVGGEWRPRLDEVKENLLNWPFTSLPLALVLWALGLQV